MAKVKKNTKKRKENKKNVFYSFTETLNNLKKIRSLDGFKSALNLKLFNPVFQAHFFSSQELFKENFRKKAAVRQKGSLLQELYISAVQINKNKTLINKFGSLKIDFERLILLGDIELAHDCLEQVRALSGLSYWYLENKFALLARKDDKATISDFYHSITAKLNSIEKRDLDLLFDKSIETIPSDRIDFSLDSLMAAIDIDSTDYATINFLFRFDPSKISDFEGVLRYISPCNVIDIYLATIRVYFTFYANRSIDDELYQSIFTIKGIDDPKWLNFISIISEEFTVTEREKVFLNICDEYIKGNFENVVKLSEQALSTWPEMVTIYEFYVNSLYNTGLKSQLNPDGLLYQIINSSLKYTIARGELSINDLNKKLYQYTTVDASQFVNLIKSKNNILTQKKTSETMYRFMDISSTSVNPFRQNAYNDGSFCNLLFKDKNSEEVIKGLPEYRALKRRADKVFDAGDYHSASKFYNEITSYPCHLSDEIQIKRILCLLKSGKIEAATTELCDQFFSNNINMKRFPSEYFLQGLEDSPEEIPCTIELIISIFILTKATNGDMQTVALHFDDYMDIEGFSFPSDILPDTEEKKYLLEFVLNTDVLEGIHICRKLYDSPSHLMFDRVLILSSLLDIEDNLLKQEQFKKEIGFLGHQYAKNFSLKDLSPGKIEVDRAALTSIALENHKELFANIVKSLESEAPLPNFDAEGDFEGTEIISHRSSFTFVYQLLLDIRDLYTLDGYYGLDYSLNTDIRHNGIVPVIRSVFEKHNLISNKVDGKYVDNTEFESRYKIVLQTHFYELMQKELRDFSAFIDLRINNLKTRVIKIITNENDDKERVFKFIITEKDVNKLLYLIKSGASYEDAIKWSFDHLENLTEQSMEVGRALILEGLDSEFTTKLNKLNQSILRIGRGYEDFIDRVSAVKNDLRHTLFDVSEWLAFSKKTGEDFSLDFPIYEAKLFVEKIFPKVTINIEINNDDESVLYDGKSLKSFIKVFIMLIENAAKRRLNKSKIDINVSVINQKQSVTIKVSNLTKKIDKKIIEDINSNINGVDITSEANKEKGSGLYKIKKIFDIDLKIDNKVEIITVGKTFTVSITYLNKPLRVLGG